MKSYNIDEIIDICKNQDYGFVCLTDQMGNELIPYNSRNTAFERLEEIKTRLSSPALKDGVYYVKCKDTNRKNALSDDYLIYKGEKLSEGAIIAPPTVITHEVLTYDSALKFQVRIKELELENQNLKSQISDLQAEIEELETELKSNELLSEEIAEEAKPTMLESAKEFLSELVTIGAPLLDKHFDLKQQALNLEAQKLLRGYGSQPKPQPNKQAQAQAEAEQRKKNAQFAKVESWISSKSDDEEIYNALIALYNNSDSIPKFLELLNNYNTDLYEELYNEF